MLSRRVQRKVDAGDYCIIKPAVLLTIKQDNKIAQFEAAGRPVTHNHKKAKVELYNCEAFKAIGKSIFGSNFVELVPLKIKGDDYGHVSDYFVKKRMKFTVSRDILSIINPSVKTMVQTNSSSILSEYLNQC